MACSAAWVSAMAPMCLRRPKASRMTAPTVLMSLTVRRSADSAAGLVGAGESFSVETSEEVEEEIEEEDEEEDEEEVEEGGGDISTSSANMADASFTSNQAPTTARCIVDSFSPSPAPAPSVSDEDAPDVAPIRLLVLM